MKPYVYIPILLLATTLPGHAEIFKCQQASGKTSYQTVPCPQGTAVEHVVPVKEMSPEQVEEAKSKLKQWQEQQAVEEEVKRQAEKERQDELRKQESLELQRRSVAAQEQQTILEQQRQYQGGGGLYFPYGHRWGGHPYYPYNSSYPGNNPNFNPMPYPHPPDLPQIPPPPSPPPGGPITHHNPGTDKDNYGFR